MKKKAKAKPKNKKTETHASRMQSLMEVGLALSSERELSKLMQILLENSMEVTQAEGASVYLVEHRSARDYGNVISLQTKPVLRFLRSTNRRIGNIERSGILDVDASSIAGYVCMTRQSVNIKDCYNLPEDSPFKFNPQYDAEYGYVSKSMMAIPMVTSGGKIRGVIQLVNKLSDKGLKTLNETGKLATSNIVGFTNEDEELLNVFASHAAIAIENSKLTESIENLFESFVRASVKAIEARDPTTSGHSDRVAMMTVELARAAHNVGEGPYKELRFTETQIRELRYAALLHDFGKIGVSEPVLLKKKKLLDRELESVLIRFDALVHREENELLNSLCLKLINNSKENSKSFDPEMAYHQAKAQIDTLKMRVKTLKGHVITANEPQIMSHDFNIDQLVEKIVRINEMFNNKILTLGEIKTLSIARGSLTPDERKEVESHVSHTYEFLKQIAWTEDLSHITEIAHCHHEKMDGTGYPRGIGGEQIPIQARMMTIADIYDALTAFDRPYKKSLSPARALEILVKDARAQKIDGYLLKIFIEAGVFHHATLGTTGRRVG